MSLHTAKPFKNALALAGAALIGYISAATAGDVQQQARDLLTGTIAAHPAPQSPLRDAKVSRPTADAQESARQLLLGATGSRGESARKAGPDGHGDAQAAARQLLLGQPVPNDAAELIARRAH